MPRHWKLRRGLAGVAVVVLGAGCHTAFKPALPGTTPAPIATAPFDGSALTERTSLPTRVIDAEVPVRILPKGSPLRIVLYVGSRIAESTSDWEAGEREIVEQSGRYVLGGEAGSTQERTVRRTEIAVRPSSGDDGTMAERARTEAIITEELSAAGARVLDKAFLLRLQAVRDSSASRQRVEMAALARQVDVVVEAIHHRRSEDARDGVLRIRAIRVLDGQVLATASTSDDLARESVVEMQAVPGEGYVEVTQRVSPDTRVRRTVARVLRALTALY